MVEEQSKEERIGFHKGSLATLAKERQELQRILSIVEQLMQMHISGLKELGIDLTEQIQEEEKNPKKDKKPIEDLI
jgi:thiaminase